MYKVYYEDCIEYMDREKLNKFVEWATANDIPFKILDALTESLIVASYLKRARINAERI